MTSPPSSVITVSGIRIGLPDLAELVANCCEIDIVDARRIVDDQRDTLMLAIEIGAVQLLARHGKLAQHVGQ
jgi:hypothetical protein